jgi:starch phosphorylase
VPAADGQAFRVQVYLGELAPESVRVELYAEPRPGAPAERVPLRSDHALSGSAGGFLYVGTVPNGRPAGDYTPRVVPAHAEAMVPAETRFISWYPA